MSIRVFAGIVGCVAVLVGVILMGKPVSVTTFGETGTCSSRLPFDGVPNDLILNNAAYEDFHNKCAEAASTRQAWSWGLVGVGGVAAAGALLVRKQQAASTPDSHEAKAS